MYGGPAVMGYTKISFAQICFGSFPYICPINYIYFAYSNQISILGSGLSISLNSSMSITPLRGPSEAQLNSEPPGKSMDRQFFDKF